MAEDEPLGAILPEDHDGLPGVAVGMRRAGSHRPGVVARCVVGDLDGGDSLSGSPGQFRHRDRLNSVEDRFRPVFSGGRGSTGQDDQAKDSRPIHLGAPVTEDTTTRQRPSPSQQGTEIPI